MFTHKVYEDYYELLNQGDRAFKDALLWWLLDWPSDYEFSFAFLKKNIPLVEIEFELFKRLITYINIGLHNSVGAKYKMKKDLIKLFKKYGKPIVPNVESMGSYLYGIFIDILNKKAVPKAGTPEDNLLHGVNRIIRCFADANLIKKPIPRTGSLEIKEDVCRMVCAYAMDNYGWTKPFYQ